LATLIRNTKTNVIDLVPDHYLNHPILGAEIVAVEQEVAPVSIKRQLQVEEPEVVETTNEQE